MNDDIEARRAALRARFPVWEPVTLSGFLARSAESYGDRPFVITDERTASYAEIDAWATRLADGLAALGVAARRPGRRADGQLPGVRAGEVRHRPGRGGRDPVQLPVPAGRARLRAAPVAVPCPGHHDQLRRARLPGHAGRDRPGVGHQGVGRGAPGPAPGRAARYRRRAAGTGCLDVAGLAALGDRHPGLADASAVAPDSPGDILYTSGTTGLPKGVVVTHDAVLRTSYGVGPHPRLPGRPPDPVLAAVLPHVRLRGGPAVGDVRRRRHHPADGLLARRLLRLDRAAPGHRDPGRADDDRGAARAPRPGRVRPVLADRDLVRRRPPPRSGSGRRSARSWASARSPPGTA